MSVHAFVDETKHRGLVVVAALVEPRELAATRAMMRGFCLRGQERLHFVKERPSRRSQIASAIEASAVALHVFDASSMADPRAARAWCLERLVEELVASAGQRLVLEQDDSLVEFDETVLYAARQARGADGLFSFEHLPARSEPLLWIADAAAWCWTHGPAWRNRIEERVARVHVP